MSNKVEYYVIRKPNKRISTHPTPEAALAAIDRMLPSERTKHCVQYSPEAIRQYEAKRAAGPVAAHRALI